MPITLPLLQSTRVGMSVNALRKQSSDEEVIALAKSLIKSWKKLLDASDKAGDQRKGAPPPSCASKEASESKAPSCRRPELPRVPPTPRITTFPPVPVTCDAVRNKCREMLTAALQTGGDHVAVGVDCGRLSAQIEECIFRDVGHTDVKYKNRVRSRIANLRDARNPALRRDVLRGAIAPQAIAVMTSEGGHPGAPDGARGRRAHRALHLRQVPQEELRLHAGADAQLRRARDHLRGLQRVWEPLEVLLSRGWRRGHFAPLPMAAPPRAAPHRLSPPPAHPTLL
ncbi:transcription elongation factor A protein 2 isoform X3 [Talpa occidentalis]|nr:transcription elongation factor A protein 2 isoform X3 [Talpa occidentalis]